MSERGIKIRDLEAMEREPLIEVWAATFRTPVPRRLSKSLIRRFLATEIQVRRFGGLPASVARTLREPSDPAARPTSQAVQPGGRLLREWNGVTHVVEVTPDGYLWQGQTHRSLSAIARQITGAHWSGPRFFGLNRNTKT